MEFRALGSLSARRDGHPVAIGGPKQRMVLALLLMSANRAVTADRLIDGVWGDDSPPAARHTLHGYVSELRKVLGGQLERQSGGYALRVEPDQFDVLRFEALAAEGRRLAHDDPVAAAEQLAEALGLWEGAPYADLAYEPALQGEIRRLAELRLEAVETRIEADLAAGRHQGVTGELEALTREHPFRERLWSQLILALYRSSRQAEALRAFRRVRKLLADELGLDPSPELQALEQRILAQDQDLTPAGPLPARDARTRPQSIRGYELREVIGEGDFGSVYLAYQPSVGREVALKIIRSEHANSETFVREFEAEAQFVAQLEHPHIVSLYDYWRDPDGAYLVMPYLRGGSLAATLQRGPWSPGQALHLLDQVGSALSHAHRRGVVHRDLKPANVLLDADGNAYLSDFGIASRLADPFEAPLISSLAYLPPEALRGEPLTPASDIFSLAILTFELLTGVRPTSADGQPPIAEAGRDLPAQLARVLARATEDRQKQRHERVEDFLREIRQAFGADVVGAPVAAAAAPSDAPIRNPYKGLRAFQETDAVDFHGRQAVIDQLLEAVSRHRLVGVVGPSGSGKSSVVRAGLVPALRSGALPGSRDWLITDMFPGSYPFEELQTALLRVAVDDPASLIEALRTDEGGLMRVIKRVLPSDDAELVVIIDQFEELFSMVDDEATRRQLLDAIAAAVTDEHSQLRAVVTLRADFFDRPLEYPAFGGLLRDGLVAVTPPDDGALARAISQPARGVGLDLEPGLAGEIVADVRDQPGGLPLLQYALTELFEHREADVLTIAAYRASGGVAGALGRRAEELYAGLPEAGARAAQQLFLRLVSVDEQADDTRRRVRQSELEALDVDQPALRTVMRQFGSYRLLTFDRDPVTRSPTIEVAHEALIREWPRLRGWIAEQREELVLHRRFAAALQEWENAERADGFLLAGGRLEQFETWAGEARLLLTHQERAFLDRSRAWDRRRRRQRAVLLWSAIVVLASLAAVAFAQSRVARREAVEATARRLAGESALALDADPELAILLALEGVEISQRAASAALPEAIGALHQAVQASRLELRLDDGWGDVEISPDGSLLVTDTVDPESLLPGSDVVVRDAATGARLQTLSADALVTQEARPTDGGGRALAFSPDGGLLAVAYQEPPGAERTPIILWDPSSGQEIRRLAAPGQATWSPAWSPDGDLLAAASSDGAADAVTVWDTSTGQEIASFQSPFVGQIGFHEGMLVVTHGPAGRVGFYDPATGEEVDALETPGLTPVYLDIDRAGDRVVLAGRHESLQVWHLPSRTLRWSRPISSSRRVQVDPAGRLVALTGDEGIVRLLDLDDGSESLTLAGHTASVWDVAYHPDGERLVSVATDGETRVWDITAGGSPAIGAIEIASGRPFILDFSPDGDEIGASTWDGSFERRAAPDGELLGSVEGLVTEAGVSPAVSPDWRRLASVAVGGEATVAQLASGEPIQVLPPCTNPRAFSPDGSALVLDGLWLCALTDPPAGQPSEADLRSRVIALPSGDELLNLGERVAFRAAFNPGGALEPGRYLAVNLDTAVLEVYDMASGSLVVSLEIFPTMIRFDPTGRYLASGTLEGQAIVLDLAAIADGVAPGDAIVMQRTVGPAGIPGIALTAEGVLATSAFDSPFIRLWNVHSGELLAELRTALDGSSPPQLNFSPDGTYLLYPDAGNVLRKFPLDVDRLAELARSRITRTLTVDECRRHLEAASC